MQRPEASNPARARGFARASSSRRRTSWNEATATSIWLSSGSCVVIFCSQIPGAIRPRITSESGNSRAEPKRLVGDAGDDRDRDDARDAAATQIPGVPNSVNTKIVMIITMIRKFVPQRTCSFGIAVDQVGLELVAVLEGRDRLVLGPVVLEHAVDVLRPADQPEVADEERHAEHPLSDQR